MKAPLSFLIAATLLGAHSVCAVAAEANYLQMKEVEAEWEGRTKVLELEIETAASVPMDGKSGAFGYGALTDGVNNVLVLTSHLPIDDSTHEQAPSGFHTHVLDLKAPTADCSGANFEVDLPSSAKNTAFDANYPWSIKGNKIAVEKVPVADLGDAGVETIVTFTIKPILDAQQKPTHLCVTVVDKI
jgi:hypothetical protein